MRAKRPTVTDGNWQAASRVPSPTDRAPSRHAAGGMAANSLIAPGHWLLITDYCLITLLLLLLTLATGCRLVRGVAKVPGQAVRTVTAGKPTPDGVDPVEVQQTVLRLADDFSTRMISSVDKLRRGTNDLNRAEVLQWKIALGTETCSIASGPNAIANLLDLTVFVTVTRAAMEEHWQPRNYGESAQPMLKVCRNVETNIWRLVGRVLKLEQQADFRAAIEDWCRQNPLPDDIAAARGVNFISQVTQTNTAGSNQPGGLFNLLNLDLFSGLDPATREIAQSRLFAERALYVTQKLPVLLRWQTELLALNAIALPAVQQLVTNSTQISASVKDFNRVAEQWPGQFAPVVQQAESGGKDIVDHAFWSGVRFLVIVLVAALLYRWLAARSIFRSRNK